MSPISQRGNMADASKDGLLLGEAIQMCCSSRVEVNKFLLAYVVLF